MTKRIAVIVPQFPITFHSFTYTRARALAEAGTDVAIFFQQQGDPSLSRTQLLTAMLKAGVICRPLPRSQTALLRLGELLLNVKNPQRVALALNFLVGSQRDKTLKRSIGSLWRIYPIVFWRPDIIHIEISYLALSLLTSLELLNRPIVVSLRGADVDEKPNNSLRWRQWYIHSSQKPRLFFHCVSEHVRRKAIELGVPPSRCHVIYQGIRAEDFEYCSSFCPSSVDKHNAPRNDAVLVARLSPEKGIDIAVQAIKLMDEEGLRLNLHVIGEGPMRDSLISLVKEKQLHGRVTFYGEQTNDWVKDFLLKHRSSHIYIQPSRTEAFGQAILEAMAAGLPIVAARVGGIPELLKDKITGLLHEAESPASLAFHLNTLLSDNELATRISDNARKVVLEEFCVHKEAEAFLAWFNRVDQLR